MTIPIRNLYYLFAYAWQRFPEGGQVEVGVEESPDLPNLLARLLINSAHRLLRRGLDRGYSEIIEDTRGPKGRMQLAEIAKRQTIRRGFVVCAYDELTADVLHNRIIKATAAALAASRQVNGSNAHQLQLIVKRMCGVGDERLRGELFGRVQLSRNTGQYGAALRLCDFIFRSLLPSEDGEGSRFADILTDEVRMSEIFEEFLRNFYKLEQDEFHQVKAEAMTWSGESLDPGGWAYLPGMLTDITLRSRSRIMVIDAKFYRSTFSSRHGAPKIHSGNLYQMLAYLQHAGVGQAGIPVEGALIYPAMGEPIRLRYRLCGYDLQVATIDLMRPWPEIHAALLDLLSPPATGRGREMEGQVPTLAGGHELHH